jgi:hypothetical protein
VNLGAYTGYLAPYTVQIVRAYRDGMSTQAIADCYNTSSGMIAYVLRRVGAMQDNYPARTPDELRRIELEARRNHPEWFECSSKGRPIDMGGPRDMWINRDPWSNH